MPSHPTIKKQSVVLTILCYFFALQGISFAQAKPGAGWIDHDRIHVGDVLEVDLVGSVEGDWQGRIGSDGFLSGYSFLTDEVYGLCRTPEELAAEIASRLSKNFRNPDVRVTVSDRSRRIPISLSGAVRMPHRFQVKRRVHLRELLVLAGGLSESASGTVQIYRPGGLSCAGAAAGVPVGKGEFIEVSLSALLSGDPASDPELGSGDVVTVLQAAPIYVVGGVVRPTQIATREELTVSRAIAIAGGLARNGDGRRVRIFRAASAEERATEVDLVKIAAGTAKDPVLRPFDVIEVPEKSRKAAETRPFIRADEFIRQQQAATPLIVVD